MDALLMCGGRGTRLDRDVEKPLFAVGGRPMVDRVSDALDGSRVDTTYAVVSPHAPETRAHLDLPAVETGGDGYVADLDRALRDARIARPVLTVAADLPLLAPDLVDRILDRHRGGSRSVCVPAALKRLLGLSTDTTMSRDEADLAPAEGGPEPPSVDESTELAPAGVNVVGPDGGPEAVATSHDVRLAVNVNRVSDAAVAEALLPVAEAHL